MIILKCTVLWNLGSHLQNVVRDTLKPLENICNKLINNYMLHVVTSEHLKTKIIKQSKITSERGK